MNIVVIGNGIAANSALRSIREFDKQSSVTLISDEPEFAYSACVLPEYLSGHLSRSEVFIKTAQDYQNQNANLILGRRVYSINPENRSVSLEDQEIEYDSLILATGSRATILPIKGNDLPGNYVFKTLADTDAILTEPANCYVVVGSGPIGLEACIALRSRGCDVTLIEQLDSVMPRVIDAEPANFVKKALEDMGIRVLTGTRVCEVLGKTSVEGVQLTNEVLACNAIVWAVGVCPNVDIVKPAGLLLGKTGGIWTDEYMRTSHPDIFACGDCAETINVTTREPILSMLWHSASMQGSIAGKNSLGISKPYSGTTVQVVVNLPGLSIGAVGSNAASFGENAEILEWKGRNEHHWMIISEGRVVGLQSINNMSYLGPFLNAIRQGMNPDRWKWYSQIRRVPAQHIQWAPWIIQLNKLVQQINHK